MLSIIILTKNSEETLADTIESLKNFGDQLIVVDSGSDDRSVEVAKHLGATVFKNKFEDFSAQRNFAISKANNPWVLYIDDDEQITEEFKKEVKNTIAAYDKNSEIGGYYIRRKTFYYGKDWGFADKVQRLFYKEKFTRWHGVVHETPTIKGAFGEIERPINHYTHRSLSQMVEKTNEWSEYEAELRIKAGHPEMTWWRFFRVIVTAFFKSYVFEKGYKNGTEGIIEAIYQSFSIFITYAKLWEMQREKK
ncbi:MAG: hypothetical protein COX79_04860 [Candidatus Levybacteria bacterium CG_4_10_14_0_2_um_filter_36_16]|nr:MAG: hypothetical protein AUK12_00505 [Candidatus Levybacteria bacterium CG2_30_37_29]PIR79263.1 MAG: hypothetical protein COU26_02070 [Candidatus Levybacteria bacterium CG10_big_fil_rev_8_21_14_0_10_36_30]PIZ96573.1 MAG: hypothetical protein COX79_04860 [Candidatus Levybacteria bacterium CG_4_10_14_0_2_um_filter_36_16]PJA90336.1 MAG: hypothetical protein CO136_02405 [Candidatus Levybacteria bacterium CG_4_9_14_3_um_filter_36_7]